MLALLSEMPLGWYAVALLAIPSLTFLGSLIIATFRLPVDLRAENLRALAEVHRARRRRLPERRG